MPRQLGEVAAFGGSNVEPSVRSCFRFVSMELGRDDEREGGRKGGRTKNKASNLNYSAVREFVQMEQQSRGFFGLLRSESCWRGWGGDAGSTRTRQKVDTSVE